MNTPVMVKDRSIGLNSPCFIVAEIGINHNGDMHLARKTIDAAAQAGADAIKVQNYRTEDFVGDRSLEIEYPSNGESISESQYDLFKRCELSTSDLQMLAEHTRSNDLIFFSTPTSGEGIQELIDLNVQILKNGSDYLVHLPLIREMARTGLPTVLSTGMATLEEIDRAVCAYREANGQDLILLQCTSVYPAPDEEVHLRKMDTLRTTFDCPVGLSDHTNGMVAPIASTARGSCFLEKHFTLDRSLPGPDHRFSADPDELSSIVKGVRQVEKQLGSSEVCPTKTERESRRQFRLSCAAARNLSIGDTITEDDLTFRRPGDGVAPHKADLLVGRTLKNNVSAGSVIRIDQLE